MPQLFNNQLDEPIILDGDVTFSKGQASNVRKNVIIEGGYDIGKNTDFDVFGNISTRRGVAQLVGDSITGKWDHLDGATDTWTTSTSPSTRFSALKWSASLDGSILKVGYFDTPKPLEQIILANSDPDNVTPGNRYLIKYVGETGSVESTSGTFASTATDVYFAQLVDRMYYCDGVGALKYVNDDSAAQAITAGIISSVRITNKGQGYTTAPTVTVAGEGSGTGASFTVTLGPSGRVVDIAVSGSMSNYAEGTSISLTPAPTDPEGTDATAEPRISQTPSEPKLLVSHANRLFCASADVDIASDTLFASDLLDGESWDILGNSIRVGGGDGDPITALLPWYGFKLIVFKERSVWVVDTDPSQEVADWEVRLINNRVGCVSHQTAQQVGPDVYFLSRDGVRSMSTIEAGAQTDVSSPLSAPINDYIERITKGSVDRSCAVYYKNRYFLSVPLDGATTPDTTLVFNAEQGSWSGFWVGWEPRSFVVTAFSGKIRLQFGDNAGKLYTWQDFVDEASATESDYKDQTADYETKLLSRAYNYKEIYADKLGYQVEFDVDNRFSNSQDVSFFYLRDMNGLNNGILLETGDAMLTEDDKLLQAEVLGTLERDVAVPAKDAHFTKSYNMLSRGKFKEVQYMASTNGGRLSLHAVKSSAFADTINPER